MGRSGLRRPENLMKDLARRDLQGDATDQEIDGCTVIATGGVGTCHLGVATGFTAGPDDPILS